MSERSPETEKISTEFKAESKEPIVINKIYQFTHPNFHGSYFPHKINQKEYRELRQRWTKAVNEIEQDPQAILFYVTQFSVEEFQNLKKKRSKITGEEAMPFSIREQLIMEELSKIKKIKGKLKDRFLMLLPSKNSEEGPAYSRERERLEALLKNRNIKLPDPEEITINCFGEYLGSCVKVEAQYLAQLLGVPLEIPRDEGGTYIQPVKELSLSIQDAENLK